MHDHLLKKKLIRVYDHKSCLISNRTKLHYNLLLFSPFYTNNYNARTKHTDKVTNDLI